MFLCNRGLFYGVHAADSGAVTVSACLVPGAHALEKCDLLKWLLVGEADYVALCRPRCASQSFKLHACDHIEETSITVLFQNRLVYPSKPRGQDHRSDVQAQFPGFLVEIYSLGRACLGTEITGLIVYPQAGLGVYVVAGWNGLDIVYVRGTGYIQSFIVQINNRPGAIHCTCTTGRALVLVYETRLLMHSGRKLPRFSLQGFQPGICQDLYVRRPPGLNQLRCQYSQRAVIGREGLVQLGHDPTDRGLFFHQVYVVAQVGKIQSCLDPCDPAA